MRGRCGKHSCQLAEAGRGWPRLADGRWPRLVAALRLSWRWRGVSKLEGELADASGRLFCT